MTATASAQIFVDANAPGGNGTTWPNAYNNLQLALTDVANGVSNIVYVAQGNYIPTVGAGPNATFTIPGGAQIFGGFRNGDPDPANRTGSVRQTIISGDVGVLGDVSDNSFHVVTVAPGGPEVRLDGLHITEGNAVGGMVPADQVGAGVTCVDSDLRLEGCIFSLNNAVNGGAIWFDGGAQGDGFRASNSIFFANTATGTGGAIDFHDYGIPAVPSTGFPEEPSWIFNCQFRRNLAGVAQDLDPVLALQGGGAIHFDNRRNESASAPSSTPLVMLVANSLFTDNAVHGRGAACWLKPAPPGANVGRVSFVSCTLAFNTVLTTDNLFGEGGQLFVQALEPTAPTRPVFVNSIAFFTRATGGAQGGNAITGPGSAGNTPVGSTPFNLIAANSDVELLAGAIYGQDPSNLNTNPNFVSGAARNLRLRATSACRNAGVDSSGTLFLTTLLPDYPDLDGMSPTGTPINDPIPLDLFLQQERVQGGRIDMGCFEFDE